MEKSKINDVSLKRKVLKIKIFASIEVANSFELIKEDLDKDSLHPNYGNCFSKKPEFFSRKDKSKLSIQIESFLRKHRNSSAPSNKNLSKDILSVTRDMTESVLHENSKRSKAFKSCGCSGACVIA